MELLDLPGLPSVNSSCYLKGPGIPLLSRTGLQEVLRRCLRFQLNEQRSVFILQAGAGDGAAIQKDPALGRVHFPTRLELIVQQRVLPKDEPSHLPVVDNVTPLDEEALLEHAVLHVAARAPSTPRRPAPPAAPRAARRPLRPGSASDPAPPAPPPWPAPRARGRGASRAGSQSRSGFLTWFPAEGARGSVVSP